MNNNKLLTIIFMMMSGLTLFMNVTLQVDKAELKNEISFLENFITKEILESQNDQNNKN